MSSKRKISELAEEATENYIKSLTQMFGGLGFENRLKESELSSAYKKGMERWLRNRISRMKKSLKQSERLAKKYWDWYKRLKKEKYKELAIKHEVRQIRLKHYIQMEQEIRELEKKLRKRKK